MYGDHQCEVSKSDLDRATSDVRYDLERKIEEQGWEIRRLGDRIESLRQQIQSMQDALETRRA